MENGAARAIPPEGKIVPMDHQMFASIINMIPAGKLITIEAIEAMWAKREGADRCVLGGGLLPYDKNFFFRPSNVQRIDFLSDLNDAHLSGETALIPYWRIISVRGNLIDFATYYSKEMQKQLLEREGHTVLQPNPEVRRYIVENYKDALFDLNKLIINET